VVTPHPHLIGLPKTAIASKAALALSAMVSAQETTVSLPIRPDSLPVSLFTLDISWPNMQKLTLFDTRLMVCGVYLIVALNHSFLVIAIPVYANVWGQNYLVFRTFSQGPAVVDAYRQEAPL
jgi:hypothetical protein